MFPGTTANPVFVKSASIGCGIVSLTLGQGAQRLKFVPLIRTCLQTRVCLPLNRPNCAAREMYWLCVAYGYEGLQCWGDDGVCFIYLCPDLLGQWGVLGSPWVSRGWKEGLGWKLLGLSALSEKQKNRHKKERYIGDCRLCAPGETFASRGCGRNTGSLGWLTPPQPHTHTSQDKASSTPPRSHSQAMTLAGCRNLCQLYAPLQTELLRKTPD